MRSFAEFCRAALKAFNESGADYAIVVGVAAVYYGRPRTTVDVDLVIKFEPDTINKICARLSKHGFIVSLKEIESAVRERAHISVFNKGSPYRLDLREVTTPLDEASLARKQRVEIYGENTWMEALEDLIIAKLTYGSPQDLEDVQAILVRQKGKFDREYLSKQAEKMKVKRTLAKILKA